MSWPLVKLKDCCAVVGGATPKREVPEYWDSTDVPWVTPKDVSDLACPTLEDAPEYISEAGFKSCSTSMLPKGSVLVTSRAPIGNIAIAGRNLCTNQGFKSLIPGESVDGLYLYYCMKHSSQRLQALGNGATFKEVSKKIVEEFEIPLPPLPEQKRIAAILDKTDAIRRKRQQAIQLADDFLSAQFLQKFGDPKDSPFGSKSLKDVALKVTDGAHFTPTYVESGIPFLRVTDINRGEVDWSKVKYIPLEEHQELIKRCKPEKGDVLYSKNGTIGVPRLIDWDQEFSIFVSLCLIKPNPNYLRGRYLYSFLQTPFALKQATQKAKSATVTNLHLVEIKEIKLPVPSLSIQDEWIDFVDGFDCMRARLIESLNKSNDAFNSLSQKAFSGQL